ncbi:MAG TPA: hypothetical protein VJ743_17335, partial [Albitalea sp.]|nr:hypothetical protein [Albitalea sp.]
RTRAWVERMEQLLPPPSRYPGAGAALAVAGLVAIIAASSHDGGSGGLSAPTGLAPGSASAQQPPTLSGCRSLTLSWRPVSGAHDYVVTVEPPSSPTRSAAAAPTLTTGAASVALPRGLYGLIRWHVHARDARGKAGPESSSMHFYCPG